MVIGWNKRWADFFFSVRKMQLIISKYAFDYSTTSGAFQSLQHNRMLLIIMNGCNKEIVPQSEFGAIFKSKNAISRKTKKINYKFH